MRLIPESLLYELMNRPGDMPTPGNNRWGKAKILDGGESYTFINTEMLPIVTPMAIQLSFSQDGQIFTPYVPLAFPNPITVTITKAVDVKSGAFTEVTVLDPGDPMPFCTLIAKALTVMVENSAEGNPPIYVHAVACPTTAIDCASVTEGMDTPWNAVTTVKFAANTAGVFVALPASTGTRQIIIQNNSAVPLYLGFGGLVPSLGPPPVSNMILPGGINALWESQLGAFTGAIRGIFGAGGLATEFATFTRGIHT